MPAAKKRKRSTTTTRKKKVVDYYGRADMAVRSGGRYRYRR